MSLALVASLGGCVTTTGTVAPTPIESADAAVAQAQAAYDRARLFADVLMPLLPPSYQRRLSDAEDAADRAFAAAHAAVLLADQLAALRRAKTAMREIDSLTTGRKGT